MIMMNISTKINAKHITQDALNIKSNLTEPINSKMTIDSSTSSSISWIKQMQIINQILKGCEKNSTTWYCVKISSLQLLENITSHAIIPLWHGIRFVRTSLSDDEMRKRVPYNVYWHRKDLKHLTWFDRMAMSFSKIFTTHVLEINLKELTDFYMDAMENYGATKDLINLDPIGTARHRRHRYNMMMTMMFGVTAFGAVIVPMGFQLLSIVSGKALLLAKMALLLASINGLKRVANTGLHYGLYHTPNEHYGSYYDRGDVHHPRNVPNLTPILQPVELI
uniref:Uncharacterized protein n=1 Tax=Glossina brevipalpis TaxID=37001 RepID=A0A1A9WPQ6_9MUSC